MENSAESIKDWQVVGSERILSHESGMEKAKFLDRNFKPGALGNGKPLLERAQILLAAVGPWSAAALTLAVGMLIHSALERDATKRHQQNVRTKVVRAVATVRGGTEVAINKRVFLTVALKYHVSVNPAISSDEFDSFASLLMSEAKGIRSLTLIPNNEITDIYPREGNESAIGLNLLKEPGQREAALRAIATGNQQLCGPVDLKQGGRAFINRAPLNVAASTDSQFAVGDYWGMVSVLIDYDELVNEIQEYVPSDLEIAIQTRGDNPTFLVGSDAIKQANPIATEVAVANDVWRLYGVPRDGWPVASPGASNRQEHALVFSGLAALLVFLLVRTTARYLRAGGELRLASLNAQRIRAVLEKTARMARVGGWEFDLTAERIIWSDEVCRIHDRPLGHTPTLEEAVEYYTPAARATIADAIKAAIDKDEPWDLELPLVTANGREIWVRSNGEPGYENGRCVRLWGTFQDVTHVHEAQQQMRLTQRAVESAADAIFFLDPRGQILFANAAGRRHLGEPGDVSQFNMCDFDTALSPESWREKIKLLQQNDKCEYESQLRSVADTLIDCEVRLWFVESEAGQQIVASFRDTSRAKREAELRDVLFEQSSDAHLLFDKTGIIECNQAAVEMLCMKDKEQILASHPAEFSPEVQPDGRLSLEKCKEMDAFAYENGTHRFDWMHKRSDGEEFLCEVTLNSVQLESGPALLVVWHDISERKKVIDKLAASNLELQQFAYVASHDLQAPLRGIANFAHFLKEDHQSQLNDEATDFVDRIVSGCKRMQQLISDLLSYSRVDGRARPFQPVDLNQVVDQAIEILEPSIADSNGLVTRDNLPTIVGDASQMLQLMQNLVCNGLKYHHCDGVPKVHVAVEQREFCYVISVRDNGIGIEAEAQERVFEIFKRLHTQDEYPGTGIGLAICRRIVEQHAGEISLESTPGEGSTFCFTLPLRGQPPGAENETAPTGLQSGVSQPSC